MPTISEVHIRDLIGMSQEVRLHYLVALAKQQAHALMRDPAVPFHLRQQARVFIETYEFVHTGRVA